MKDYLNEAFKQLNILNEDTFSFDSEGAEDLKDFKEKESENDEISIIDIEAQEAEELKPSYVGKLILDCDVCHSKLFMDESEIVKDEDSDLVNVEMECPYCHCEDGYTIIGKVCDAHCDDCDDEHKEDESEVEIEDENEEDVEEGLLSGDNNISIGNNNSSNLNLGDVAGAAASLAPMLLASDAGEKKSLKNRRLKEDKGQKRLGLPKTVKLTFDDIDEDAKKDSYVFEEEINDYLSDNFGFCVYNWDYKTNGNDITITNINWDTSESLKEDTVKTKSGKWVNKGKEGTHGEFRTKKAADAQRKAMFAQGYKADEELNESDKPAAISIEDAQKWVDYDMEHYHKISKRTNELVKKAGFQIIKDDHGDYEVAAGKYDESLDEDFKEVKIETEDTKMEMTSDENGKVTVTTEPIKEGECETCENSEEVIKPLSDEEKGEIEVKAEENDKEESTPIEVEAEEEIDDFDEESFDELGESYLKEVYDNVDSYKTTKTSIIDNKLYVEGVINFNSGKSKNTQFIFESKRINNKMRLIGENAQITKGKKSFKVSGSVVGKKFLSESFNYNYSTKDNQGKSIRLYNTIKRNK